MTKLKTLLLTVGLSVFASVNSAFADNLTTNSSNGEHVQFKIRRGEVPCRGVNLGSWLVAENWMSWESPLWEGVPKAVASKGEFAMMQYLGQKKGDAAFQSHWASWITEKDFEEIAGASLNTVRIPVGFWIRYDDSSLQHREVYYPKGALAYLDLAMQWGEKYNLSVLLSLHAHQGSQNGFEHSAPLLFGQPLWSDLEAFQQNSVDFAKYLAARYASSPAFLGMSLMNEPHLTTSPLAVRSYFKRAYAEVRTGVNRSDCVLIVAPMLSEQEGNQLVDFMVDAPGTNPPVYYNVWHERHKYYLAGFEANNETQLVDAVKSYKATEIDTWTGKNPLFFGEWSMVAAIQFSSSGSFRAFGSAQLESLSGVRSGWTFWSWRHSEETNMRTGWSLRRLLKDGDLVLTA
ncbi:hypothetical protein Gpo141_00009969 [Globisporangium polare]